MTNLQQMRRQMSKGFTDPIARAVARLGISPDALTVIGFLVCLGAAAAAGWGRFLLGGILVLVAGVFDLLDGAVARASNRTTVYGALLDSTLDRLSEAAILVGVMVALLPDRVAAMLVVVALTGSFMVSYVKARAEGLGLECNTGLFTRPERVIILSLALIINQVTIALYILCVFTWITVLQRLVYVRKNASKPGQKGGRA